MQALAVAKEHYGAGHIETANVQVGYAVALTQSEDVMEAQKLLLQALAVRVRAAALPTALQAAELPHRCLPPFTRYIARSCGQTIPMLAWSCTSWAACT